MHGNKKISALQLYFVLMLSIGITNHVILIPALLQNGKRDSWIGAAAAVVPLVIWVLLLYMLIKKTAHQRIMDWLKIRFGRFTSGLCMLIVIGVCVIDAIVTLKDIVIWTHVSYLPQSPSWTINLVFMIFCFFAALAGLRAIAITAGILLPGVVFLGLLVMSANFHYKDYGMLTPLFTHGYEPAMTSMILTCGASFEMISIIFIQHHVSTRIRLSSLLILALVLLILTIGPLTGAIAIFGPFEAADLRYPAFEQWRMVTMGKYISHLDFLSIYQWISGACIRMSLLLFLILDTIGVQKKQNRTMVLFGFSLFFFVLGLIPVDDNLILKQIETWYYPSMFGVGVCMLFVLLLLSMLPAKSKESERK
ncbi:endospore germination permease [Paenibacillus sp. SI8]|uniref:endospore germination permease n=1 Tax=unclassified Paenibacillus TaxID=185978 RepID=UPI003466C4D9